MAGVASLIGSFILFAQGEGDAAPRGGGGLLEFIAPLGVIFFLFYFLIIRPERRKQAEHRSLLEAVKKNDRIVTIGGIYGVVTNVQREADRVTIRVDDAANVKFDITFGSIARVIVDQPKNSEKT